MVNRILDVTSEPTFEWGSETVVFIVQRPIAMARHPAAPELEIGRHYRPMTRS